MSTNTLSLAELKDRVQKYNFTKQAAATPSAATDPAEKGTATATKDPALSDDKSKMPPSLENQSNEGKKLEDKPLEPSSVGKNMPISPKDGEAEDKKGVEKVAGIRERVAKLLKKEAKAPAPAPANTPAPVKTAGTNEPSLTQLTPDALYKLASAIFETEDGIDSVLPVLRKKAGHDAAIELMKAAATEYQKATEDAFYRNELEKRASAEQAQYENYVSALVKTASSREEAELLVKAASVHRANTKDLNEFEKMAYAQGPEDAGAMMAGEEAGAAPEIEGAQEPSLEQIAQLIQLAVQNQEISPEDGEAMLQELAAAVGGGEGAPEGGVPAEGGAPAPEGGEPPVPEGGGEPDGDEGMPKEASAARNLFLKIRSKK
jgi:hypothetical protein